MLAFLTRLYAQGNDDRFMTLRGMEKVEASKKL